MAHKNKRKNPMGVWWRRMMQKVKPSGKTYNRKQGWGIEYLSRKEFEQRFHNPFSDELREAQQNRNQQLAELVKSYSSKRNPKQW